MRITSLALVFALGWGFPARLHAQDADQQRIRKLVENLGHAKFIERERAVRELKLIGSDALAPLRQAIKSEDIEVSCRATKLVALIEHKLMTAAMLAPKRVRLNVKDMSVTEAVAALAKLGNCSIDMIGDRTSADNRKITLDTGEVSFWEAFEKLCHAGELAEQVSPATQPVYYGPSGRSPLNQPQGPRPIVVASGTPSALPTCFAGSVRVRAMPADSAGLPVPAGETHITLEVSAEPRLQNFGAIGLPILDKAIDDKGQVLSLAPLLPADPLTSSDMPAWRANAVLINGVVVPRNHPALMGAAAQRTVTLRLKNGAKAAKSLKEISGKVTVQTLSETEKVATVNDVLKAAGQKVHGFDGSLVHITSVDRQGDGTLTVQMTLENEYGPTGPVRIMRGKGNFNNGGGVPFGGPANYPKLHDSQGEVHVPEVTGMRNNGVALNVTLTYYPQREPSQLAFYGQRILTFDVPFALKNVPLP